MKQFLFSTVSLLSTLSLGVVIGIWVRSYFVVDEWMCSISHTSSGHAEIQQYELMPRSGHFAFIDHRLESSNPDCIRETKAQPPELFAHFTYDSSNSEAFWRHLNFTRRRTRTTDVRWDSRFAVLGVPGWALVFAFGIVPAIWIRGYRAKLPNETDGNIRLLSTIWIRFEARRRPMSRMRCSNSSKYLTVGVIMDGG